MKQGRLAEYFTGVAMKRLSAVEADRSRSNQHEFNGNRGLQQIFGTAPEKQVFPARFLYLDDDESKAVTAESSLTWYDARARHVSRTEHRLYYASNPVTDCASEGDLLVLGRRPGGDVLAVIAEGSSTTASQLQWLFDLGDLSLPGFAIRSELTTEHDRIASASAAVLEAIGVVVEPPPDTHLDDMLRRFPSGFPTTRVFSEYARSTLPDVMIGSGAQDDADAVLTAWTEREETLFRTFERHLIAQRLSEGFGTDVDGFISFSLSVQNRRKSRAGASLENHLETIFDACGVQYARTAKTENKSKPDFLFPGNKAYHDPTFDATRLLMLGVKTSAKERWRQVLAEADRIEAKHLLTLDPVISVHQTAEMQIKQVQLVLPRALHAGYASTQQEWLLSLGEFIAAAKARQAAA